MAVIIVNGAKHYILFARQVRMVLSAGVHEKVIVALQVGEHLTAIRIWLAFAFPRIDSDWKTLVLLDRLNSKLRIGSFRKWIARASRRQRMVLGGNRRQQFASIRMKAILN
jgi:hypothetical protein